MITAEHLKLPGIAHGFFTREGGFSQGIFTSLNAGLGSGDDPDAVLQNRAVVAMRLGGTLSSTTPPSSFARLAGSSRPSSVTDLAEAMLAADVGVMLTRHEDLQGTLQVRVENEDADFAGEAGCHGT